MYSNLIYFQQNTAIFLFLPKSAELASFLSLFCVSLIKYTDRSNNIMIAVTQKLSPISFTTGLRKTPALKGAQFNQTLLMKNTKLQIHFTINHRPTDLPLSSRGLDSSHINNNLTELGETRQLGFQNIGRRIDHPRNKSNSPYVIHKARTQDIQSIHKIYGTKPSRDPFKDVFGSIRKNGTIDQQSARSGFKDQSHYASTLEKIIKKREKGINGKLSQAIKNNLKTDVHRKNFETLPTAVLDSYLPNPETENVQTFRRNKFDSSKHNIGGFINAKESSAMNDEQFTEKDSANAHKSERITALQKQMSLDARKKAYHKTIESINRTLLNEADGYISYNYRNKVAQQSQIEVFVESIHPPEPTASPKKSSWQKSCEWQYDFQFEGESKVPIPQHHRPSPSTKH